MIVTVRYHGIVGDMLRRKTQQVEMRDGATVADLYDAITDDGAQTVLKQTRAFIDGKQADRGAPLTDGAEVTFMRPIAGGAGCAAGESLPLAGANGFTASRVSPAAQAMKENDPVLFRTPLFSYPLREHSDRHPLKPR